jgi:hypothetical protein
VSLIFGRYTLETLVHALCRARQPHAPPARNARARDAQLGRATSIEAKVVTRRDSGASPSDADDAMRCTPAASLYSWPSRPSFEFFGRIRQWAEPIPLGRPPSLGHGRH